MANLPAWPTLKTKTSGKNVQALQELLCYHKYSVPVNGSFDPATQLAVTRFQKDHPITLGDTKGVAGANTLSALIVSPDSGSNNKAVRAAQTLLKKFESKVTINGAFDTSVLQRLLSFQEKMGLRTTAAFDSLTWQYLFGYNSYPLNASVGTVSTLNEAQMYVNAKYISSYLQTRGFTKNAACAILGNMYAETSKIDPGLWEDDCFDSPRGGYGLVQWTTYKYEETKEPNPFLLYAAEIGLISDSRACSELDSLALSNPKKLMNAELDWLIKSMGSGTKYFFYNPEMNHTGRPKMTFEKFKKSTLAASELAIIFHDYYERSTDSEQRIKDRRAIPAQNYFDTGLFD